MPCTAQPLAQVLSAVARLENALAAGSVTVKIGAAGAIAFVGWKDNAGVADLCAYRRLVAQGSPALRRAMMRAEVTAGRKVDARTIAAGLHSHDGGNTWGTH